MTTQISQIRGDLDKIMFGKVAVVLENHSIVLMLERPHGYYHSNIYLTKKELFTGINIDTHTISKYVHTTTHCAYRKEPFMSAINV